MKNFKQIAEDCLAGKLSGTFVIDKEKNWHSSYLQKYTICGHEMPGQYVLGSGVIYNEIGECIGRERTRIIDFIPDMKKEQITIDIPEGKTPVMEQTENGVVITWKEKELTYGETYIDLCKKDQHISVPRYCNINDTSRQFNKKVEVLRKLTNIRNYFGKPENMLEGWCIFKHSLSNKLYAEKEYCTSKFKVAFAKKEHAEQAIKMLGDELKYLFEPW